MKETHGLRARRRLEGCQELSAGALRPRRRTVPYVTHRYAAIAPTVPVVNTCLVRHLPGFRYGRYALFTTFLRGCPGARDPWFGDDWLLIRSDARDVSRAVRKLRQIPAGEQSDRFPEVGP